MIVFNIRFEASFQSWKSKNSFIIFVDDDKKGYVSYIGIAPALDSQSKLKLGSRLFGLVNRLFRTIGIPTVVLGFSWLIFVLFFKEGSFLIFIGNYQSNAIEQHQTISDQYGLISFAMTTHFASEDINQT